MTGGRPGIVTSSGGWVVMLLAVVIGALVLCRGRPALAQFFSPGPLARPHSDLEGLEKCARCHAEQKGLSAKLCLDCHAELAGRVAKGAGFHGRLPADKKNECQRCHPDHRGLGFSMVKWEGPREKFDHQRTGWPLRGGHAAASVRCDDCHQSRLIVEPAIRRMIEKQPKRTTFLGLGTKCETCHFDEHRGQLTRDCHKCHNETAWKPTAGFNHQATAYPLEGKHKDVACAKCHPSLTDDRTPPSAFPRPRATSYLQMKPIESKSCESCHQDPHKGSLGPDCAGCHSEAGWRIIKTTRGQDTGFHDKTRFPLRGGHLGVACRSCHGPFPGQAARFRGLPFAACTDCHEDAHLGQLRGKPTAKVAPCEGCHTVAAFMPPRYELEQHQGTRFPLEGGHAVAACRGCHPIDPDLGARITATVHQTLRARKRPERFSLAVLHPRKTVDACSACHEDVHRGQFAQRRADTRGDPCRACHQTSSFADLTFDHDKDSRFPLTGKHARAACESCHKRQRVPGGAGATFVRYRPLDVACRSCHTDVHQGQFLQAALEDEGEGESRGRRAVRDCDVCHETDSFQRTIFDHGDRRFTTFFLDGKHVKVACAGCHPVVSVAGGVETVRYRPVPRACEGCHTDFHHGEFRGFEP